MKLDEAKISFIQSWGSLGSQWGINKTLARIQALLLITDSPLNTDEIMAYLGISRGNVNMNIRTLIDWGLVYKKIEQGERKEYFNGEKDLEIITKRVIKIRRQKELAPMLYILNELNKIELEGVDEQINRFKKRLRDINSLANKADKLMDKIEKSGKSWFWNLIMKYIK